MPGAYDDEGRVAVFSKATSAAWTRTATLKASDAAPAQHFGKYTALASGKLLVASKDTLYVYTQGTNGWSQTQRISLPTDIEALAWNGKLAAVTDGRTAAPGFTCSNRDRTVPCSS
jgi:hypothetical protein